ncbi:thioredoxin family protein [Microbacteriaceae bacterium 4G12]
MNLMDWAAKGMTFDEYVESMKVNKEELLYIYKEVKLPEAALQTFQQGSSKNWIVIVLAADWCGDALACVPVVKRICEAAQFSMHLLIRDENLELMDQYLTNGTARAIPIFIFVDEQGKEQAVWGPRSKEVQDMITELRSKLPSQDDPTFEEKQKAMYQSFRERLVNDTSIWTSIINSVEERLRPVLF